MTERERLCLREKVGLWVGLLTKNGDVEPKMVMWNLFMFAIHKHKLSESQLTVSRGPPRLNLSDTQTLISDGFSKI
jgi:hypothetical protein